MLPIVAVPSRAYATCGVADPDLSDLFSLSPPAPDLTLKGEAPFQVTITFIDKTVESGALAMTLSWGDGVVTPVNIVSCGGDVYSFPAQQLSHTFTSPGAYSVQWHLSSPFLGQVDSLAVIVTVTAAATQPPATPTSVPPPTLAAVPTTPEATTGAVTPDAPAATPTPEPSATPSPLPATVAATASPTQTPTAQAARTPTQSLAAAGPGTTPEPPRVPPFVADVPDLSNVSTDAGVATTNIVLAGVTVWVFFTSVLFNQTLQQNREEVEGWALKFRPKRGSGWLRRRLSGLGRWPGAALVLAGTGLVYAFIEPGVGLNRPSLVLFLSVVLGVGVTGFVFAGLETWIRTRTPEVQAEVRPFPLALVIGASCVAASRLLSLHPGVVYGFAASCVAVTTSPNRAHDGKVMSATVTVTAAMSLLCWLLLEPVRSLPNGFGPDILEATIVIIFIGGMEALVIDLLPLDVMDGGKIFAWSRLVWVLLTLPIAFLIWHVLLNTHRSSFTSLREATSWSVLAAFGVYTLAGVGLWTFFRVRDRRARRTIAA